SILPINLYVAHAVGTSRFKIGATRRDVELRKRDLQTGSAFKLEFICMVEAAMGKSESEAHARLKRWATHGEWFDLGEHADAFRRRVSCCETEADLFAALDDVANAPAT